MRLLLGNWKINWKLLYYRGYLRKFRDLQETAVHYRDMHSLTFAFLTSNHQGLRCKDLGIQFWAGFTAVSTPHDKSSMSKGISLVGKEALQEYLTKNYHLDGSSSQEDQNPVSP